MWPFKKKTQECVNYANSVISKNEKIIKAELEKLCDELSLILSVGDKLDYCGKTIVASSVCAHCVCVFGLTKEPSAVFDYLDNNGIIRQIKLDISQIKAIKNPT